MRIGYLGCGKMADVMASFMSKMKDCELYACAARDFERANNFKVLHNFEKAYGSYEELVNDKNIDVIYISTVTKTHHDLIKLCLDNNQNVMCEKPFCINYKEAKEVVDLARKKNLFLSEAIWTRYMPIRNEIKKIIADGYIGLPYLYAASIGYAIDKNERMQDSIGGGVLLDCGVYPLNFVMMFSEEKIINLNVSTSLSTSKVDEIDLINLDLTNDTKAIIYCSMKSNIDCSAFIYGDKGYIKFDHVNHPTKISIYNNNRPPQVIKTKRFKLKGGGYEYQWIETIDSLKNGKKENPSMPLDETLEVMKILDSIRAKAGIKFKNE